ncbi:MAG TPA: hypothetical protein VMP86_04175 [Candidatus Binatia bacterium]|nr:hypothetical protein [Candidatus Binatia bacterium]
MNNTAKLALGAVAVVVAALLGITFLVPGGPSIGGPGPSNEASLAPEPTPTALRASVGEGRLEPGTYVSHPLASNPLLAVTFTVPDGWYAFDDSTLVPLGEGFEGPDGAVLAFLEISDVYSDPCESLGDPDVDAGATAEDLADAFSAQPAYEASVTDLTLDGYSGKQVEFQLPSEFDASCPRDEYFVFGGGPYPQGPDNRWHLTILDVDGSRLVIFTHDFAGTPASRQADLESMIASIEIEIEIED